jgi:hypothetical protein
MDGFYDLKELLVKIQEQWSITLEIKSEA